MFLNPRVSLHFDRHKTEDPVQRREPLSPHIQLPTMAPIRLLFASTFRTAPLVTRRAYNFITEANIAGRHTPDCTAHLIEACGRNGDTAASISTAAQLRV